ncbi:MAG: ATP-binding protein [Ginsengibacter sp.]
MFSRANIVPLLVFFSFSSSYVCGQNQKIADSVRVIYLQNNLPDTAKLELLRTLSFYEVRDLRLSLQYAEELISLSTTLKNDLFLSRGYLQKGNKQRLLGNMNEALDAYIKSADAARKARSIEDEGSAYGAIGDVYSLLHNHSSAMIYYNKSIAILRSRNNPKRLASAILNAGDEFRRNDDYDSALYYFDESKHIFELIDYKIGVAYSLGNMGMVYMKIGNNNLAEKNFKNAIPILDSLNDYSPICDYLLSLAKIYLEQGKDSAALKHASQSLTLAKENNFKEQIRDATFLLSEINQKLNKPEVSLAYYKEYVLYRDSIENKDALQRIADLRTNFEVAKKQVEVDSLSRQQKLQRIILSVALAVLLVIIGLVIILLRNNREKQTAYTLLRKEKDLTEQQRDQTNKALQELKRAQAHLIQSEKMASLGELTAGIAHEIQNPLNFVNNFSEVNTELINELKEENRKGNYDAVNAISEEIIKNEEKINQHGKRADAIVKGMLEHSRAGTPEKRLTNINALADEYARLSYLGLRAKDKTFTATLHTDFDPQAGKVIMVPQEIGRVILNLVNNAFHAVNAKAKEAQSDFTPTVTISTKKTKEQLQISVKDNGTGIPDSVREKIFQPFFTTKAPGIGTGLGLSLSYDIVKGHGGEIKVNSETGTGSEFIVILPL